MRCNVECLQARAAEPVELHTAGGIGQSCSQCSRAGDIPTLIANRGDHTQDDVADQSFIEVGAAAAHFVDETHDQVEWLDLGQRPVALFAARGADRLVDENFLGHRPSFPGSCAATRGGTRIRRVCRSLEMCTGTGYFAFARGQPPSRDSSTAASSGSDLRLWRGGGFLVEQEFADVGAGLVGVERLEHGCRRIAVQTLKDGAPAE